jgi:ABC-type Fe3+ transport system permease subunit
MHVVVVIVVMLAVLLLGRLVEQQMFRGDAQRQARFRRRLQAWSGWAAAIAAVLAVIAVVCMRALSTTP